jgi:hypothetical protein
VKMPTKVVFGNSKPVLWFVSRVDSESRFAIFLGENLVENETCFSWKYSCESHESRKKEKSIMLCNLRDSQTSKIIIHSKKLVLGAEILAIFSQDSRVKISNDSRKSHCEISVCKTQESCYEICLRLTSLASLATKFVCETCKTR